MIVRMSRLFAFLLVVPAATTAATVCGPSGTFSIAGAGSVSRLTRAWKDEYEKDCPGSIIEIAAAGSSDGAARVCGTRQGQTATDIGGMSRTWHELEGSTKNGWTFDCQRSKRSVIQVDVGFEGMAFMVGEDSLAFECIEKLGGLTTDQIRWMYSNLGESDLKDTGWNPFAIPNSDNDESTKLWSELHEGCEPEEIVISGTKNDMSGVDDFFVQTIFNDDGEEFRDTTSAYWTNNVVDIAAFIGKQTYGITFLTLSRILSNDVNNDIVSLKAVPVRNGIIGPYAEPIGAAFWDQSYPLSRRIYMNLLDEEDSLAQTRPFIDFGFSEKGTQILRNSGLWPILDWEKVVMRTRAQTASGIPKEDIQCGPAGGQISIAGSSTVFPVTNLWARAYELFCNIEVNVEGGGSSVGAGRVCDNPERGPAVDIGNMSREWKTKEASEVDGFRYNCLKGDTSRSAIQIDVAIDGITVVTKKGGVAEECIKMLGGLTVDQLRWIYSSYSDSELEEVGWDPTSLKNSDSNPQTRRWSELDERCAPIEIRIAGADDLSGTFEYFEEVVMPDFKNGEHFDSPLGYFNSEADENLVGYVEEFGEAISYFGYSYYSSKSNSLYAVPIENNDGALVTPNPETVGDGSYNPLTRRLFLNVFDDAGTIEDIRPFIKFGFSQDYLVTATGYVNIPNDVEMIERIDNAPYNVSDDKRDDGLQNWAIVLLAILGFVVLVLASYYLIVFIQNRDGDFEVSNDKTGSVPEGPPH